MRLFRKDIWSKHSQEGGHLNNFPRRTQGGSKTTKIWEKLFGGRLTFSKKKNRKGTSIVSPVTREVSTKTGRLRSFGKKFFETRTGWKYKVEHTTKYQTYPVGENFARILINREIYRRRVLEEGIFNLPIHPCVEIVCANNKRSPLSSIPAVWYLGEALLALHHGADIFVSLEDRTVVVLIFDLYEDIRWRHNTPVEEAVDSERAVAMLLGVQHVLCV